MPSHAFHLAFPVKDLESTIEFYTTILDCKIGRQAADWVDFDFYGHQLSAHLTGNTFDSGMTNTVDEKHVPARHFGAILSMDEWRKMAERFKDHNLEFVIEPYIRFKGKPGEQATMFIKDPSGNVLEFKAFNDMSTIFKTS
ncbi:MAG: VOC family protein [Calditrichaeota bacterium]|nr:VOC family protein [Calditrichota bacterium]